MANSLIEFMVDCVPRKKSFWTRGRAVAAVSIMSQLVAFAVTKRPALAPLQSALTVLLAPSEVQLPPEDLSNSTRLLRRIRDLRGQMAVATVPEQAKLQAQIDVLIEIASEQA